MKFSPTEIRLLQLSALLLLAGMLLHLGTQPLYLEEPRRALIAMEMWERGNPWIPTELGEYYYNKPPFFNWVLMGSAALLGGFHEWAMRLPTVLSVIGLVWVMYCMGRRYVDAAFGAISGLLFAACGSVLIFFSHLGEIDLFYAFVSFSAFAALYHFYRQGQDGWLFLSFYALHAVGFLTKGLPSLLFIGISLLIWFGYKKDWRRLFSWAHLAGIGLFLLMVGGYLFQYSRYHSLLQLLPEWAGQAGERTVAEQGWSRLLIHLVHYPLDSLKDLLPFSLLIVFLIRKDWKALLLRNEWVAFSAIIFLANFPVYWLSPGAKQRYLYMLFPLLLIAFTWAWRHAGELKPLRGKVFRIITGLLLAAFALGAPALGFLSDLAFLSYRHALAAGAALAFGTLFWLFWKKKSTELILLIAAMAVLRLVFDLTVLPQRAYKSGAQHDKALAYSIAHITGDAPLHIYRADRISFTTVYYLNRIRGRCLTRSYREAPNVFYLAETDCVERPYVRLLEFEYNRKPYMLFRKG